jgi:aspartokinase
VLTREAYLDYDEVEEIHDEEKILLDDFQTLVAEFDATYNSLNFPLWEFIQTHWRGRMQEYLRSHGELLSPDLLCEILRNKVSKQTEVLRNTARQTEENHHLTHVLELMFFPVIHISLFLAWIVPSASIEQSNNPIIIVK